MNLKPNVLVLDTPEQVAQAAAERFINYSTESIRKRGSFAVALAGGSTPRRAYELLASDEFRSRVEWSRVHLFFGDERMVPPDSAESNYRMVNNTLISRVSIAVANVHRIVTEKSPAKSAESYEAELKSFFGQVDWPRFDLILLGMGIDGHTASLFPGSDALQEPSRWVVATRHPETGQDRVTLSLPVINHAARIMFMVTGKAKAATLARVLRGDVANEDLPARKIRPVNGMLELLIDRAAAAAL